MVIIETKRLSLRTWEESDIPKMCEINQSPDVMRYFPGLKTPDETKKFIEGASQHFDVHGYTLYAVDVINEASCIGFIGLSIADFDAPFTPATEIGWRLSSNYWGQGLATEGAKAVLEYAFKGLSLPEIVSFTAEQNKPSIRVMEKIGLARNIADDFMHPLLSEGSPLRKHVLYRITDNEYLNK